MLELIGYLAGIGSLIGYLPQTIKTIRTRSTKDLSLGSFSIIGTSAVLWTIYGLGNQKPAIWFPNAIVGLCSLIILIIKFHSND